MFSGKLEPGWLETFLIYHGLKVIYFLITLTRFYRTTININLWGGASPIWISFLLLILNLLVLFPAAYLIRTRRNPSGLMVYILFYEVFLLLAEYYLHFINLEVNDFFQSIIKIMPPYVFSLIFIVLLAWQYRFRTFVAIVFFRSVMNLVFVFRLYNLEFINWLFWNLFEISSLLIMGGIVYFLIRRQRLQRQKLSDLNLQLGRRAAAVEELAVSWERNRLARELHDTLAHSFSALAVQLEVCRKFVLRDPVRARDFLEEAHALTVSGLNETRNALKALRSAPLEDLGLVLALKEAAEKAAARAGASLDLELPESPVTDLLPQEEQVLYRVAQEALENIVRHAGADRIGLRLAPLSPGFLLEIRDDGSGFNPEELPEGRWGLTGMRERAALIQGDFRVESPDSSSGGTGTSGGTRIILKTKGTSDGYSNY